MQHDTSEFPIRVIQHVKASSKEQLYRTSLHKKYFLLLEIYWNRLITFKSALCTSFSWRCTHLKQKQTATLLNHVFFFQRSLQIVKSRTVLRRKYPEKHFWPCLVTVHRTCAALNPFLPACTRAQWGKYWFLTFSGYISSIRLIFPSIQRIFAMHLKCIEL